MTSLFTHLPDGSVLLSLLERCNAASGQAYTNPTPAQELAADAQAAAILPLFGAKRERQSLPAHLSRTTTSASSYELWRIQYPFPQFWNGFTHDLARAVESVAQPDGTIVQQLTAETARQAWTAKRDATFNATYHQEIMPSEEALPLHIAAALAALPGTTWTAAEDGARLVRQLPAWPARLPATTQPLKIELKNGLLADTLCWAALPAESYDNPGPLAEIVCLSLIGPQKKLKAVWAAMMDNKREQIKLPFQQRTYYGEETKYLGARRLEGKGRYRTFWNREPLPESGMAHVVIDCVQASRPEAGRPFPHIVGADGTPDLPRFFQQLDMALRLPLDPAWAHTLWNDALHADKAAQHPQLIIKLPSHGCQAYWVRTDQDAQWAKIVARCAGASGPQAGAIEAVGELKRIANVTEIASEVEAD
jgi:hypothetical protein